MSDNLELRQRRAGYIAQAKSIRDAAKKENRDLTDPELTQIESLLDSATKTGLRLQASTGTIDQRIDDEVAWGKELQPARGRATDPNTPIFGGGSHYTPRHGGRGGRDYRSLFGANTSTDGWRSAGEFAGVILDGVHDNRLVRASGMGVGTDSTGGFLVPSEFSARLLDHALESEIVRPRADVFPMQHTELRVPGFDGSDHSTALFGFNTQWTEEGGEITVSTPTTRAITLKAKKLAMLTSLTGELVADMGPGAEPQLFKNLSQTIAFDLDDAFLNGNGAGKALGAMNATSLVVAAAEAGQTADTISVGNLVGMVSRLYPGCWPNAVWVTHPSALAQLLNLSHVVKNVAQTENVGGGASNLVQPDGKGGYTLLSRPLLISEKMQPLGDQGDLLLADWTQYAIGLRADLQVARSAHVYFTSDKIAVRAILRCDGQPKWADAITPANGSDTLSWCVALATRS